jgi:hypothetical protein
MSTILIRKELTLTKLMQGLKDTLIPETSQSLLRFTIIVLVWGSESLGEGIRTKIC